MIEEAEVGESRIRKDERLFGKDFALVSLTGFMAFSSFQFLMPTLPLYVQNLGGNDTDIGLIVGIYSISAMFARVLIGQALDIWGRKWPLVVSAGLFLAAMVLYNLTTTVPDVLLLRLFHGFGFGAITTTCATIVADLAPPRRRGEALGYYGNFGSVAMAIGPGIGLWLITAPGLPLAGFPLLFAAGTALGVAEMLLSLLVSETRSRKSLRGGQLLGRGVAGLFSRGAVPCSVAMLFGSFGIGAIFSFVPIYLATEDPGNVSIFFFVYAFVMTVSRPFAGRIVDRFERRLVATPVMMICAAGVGILALSPGLSAALAAAVVCGLGYGALQPTLLAIVVDEAKPSERGAAMATFMSSTDIGIAVGSTLLGVVAQVAGYRSLFAISAGVVTLGLAYFVLYHRSMKRSGASGT